MGKHDLLHSELRTESQFTIECLPLSHAINETPGNPINCRCILPVKGTNVRVHFMCLISVSGNLLWGILQGLQVVRSAAEVNTSRRPNLQRTLRPNRSFPLYYTRCARVCLNSLNFQKVLTVIIVGYYLFTLRVISITVDTTLFHFWDVDVK